MNMCGQHHAPAALPTEISVVTEVEAGCALQPLWTFPEKRIISCSCRNSNSRPLNPKKKQQLFPNSSFPNIISGVSSDKDDACSLCGRNCIVTGCIVVLISSFEVLGRKIERTFWSRSQNCGKRLLASACLSVRPSARLPVRPSVPPHGTTRFPLDGFSWNLIFAYFFEKLQKKFKFRWSRTRVVGTLWPIYIFHHISPISS